MSKNKGGELVSVVMEKGIDDVKEEQAYPFEPIKILNRLDMTIVIDVCPLQIEDEIFVLVRASHDFHRLTVEKNIEHIAFQLRNLYASDQQPFTFVEYVDRHNKPNQPVEWRQWHFKWVGSSPMKGRYYPLPSAKLNQINRVVQSEMLELQDVS